MAKLRYIGQVEKTLIDVAPLTNGLVFDVADDVAGRLLNAFPGEYEQVSDAAKVDKSKPAPQAQPTQDETQKTQALQEPTNSN